MSRRRRQSTKDLGALLSETVPVLDEDDSQVPADIDPSTSTEPEASALSEKGEAEQETVSVVSDESVDTPSAEEVADVALGEDSLSSSGQSDASSARNEPNLGEETAGTTATNEPSSELAKAGQAIAPEEEQPRTLEQPALDADLHFVDAVDTEHPEDHVESSSGSSSEEASEPVVESITWRKSTIPFREDQYNEIGRLLAEFRAEHGVQLTIAEFVRLGLDKQIQAFQDEETRPELLVELHEQQQRESQGNQNLKHSRSRGLRQFLARS